MTVEKLIKKLLKMPMDSRVIFPNDQTWNDGTYEVNNVVDFKDGTVLLASNYQKNYGSE